MELSGVPSALPIRRVASSRNIAEHRLVSHAPHRKGQDGEVLRHTTWVVFCVWQLLCTVS